jgi:hypothetical protein
MNRGSCLLMGLGVGAGFMYLFDPNLGRRRRALLRDQFTGMSNDLEETCRATYADVCQRAEGLVAEAGAMLTGERVPDDVLTQLVRSTMGHYISHPGAIEVDVSDGRVTLCGPIPSHEVSDLLAAVRSVRGVCAVEHHLDMRDETGSEAQAMGHGGRGGRSLVSAHWSPQARLLATVAGGALVMYGLMQRFPLGCGLGTAGLYLLARGVTNNELSRVVKGRGRYAALFNSGREQHTNGARSGTALH